MYDYYEEAKNKVMAAMDGYDKDDYICKDYLLDDIKDDLKHNIYPETAHKDAEEWVSDNMSQVEDWFASVGDSIGIGEYLEQEQYCYLDAIAQSCALDEVIDNLKRDDDFMADEFDF